VLFLTTASLLEKPFAASDRTTTVASITETGLGLHQMDLCLIDLIQHKGENSAGSKDSIHVNRVGAEMEITPHRDLSLFANPSMIPALAPAYQPAASEG